MANTALGRTETAILTNKSGGSVAQGDVVVVDTANASAFTTNTAGAYVSGRIGVVLEPNGIASNGPGQIAFSGYVPVINLSGTGSIGDLVKTHTVAKQGVRHAAPQVAGDFAEVLGTSATPAALLFGTVQLGGGSGAATTNKYVTTASATDLSAEVAIPGLAGSPDIASAGGAGTSEEYDTATTGLTWSSALATEDSNTTALSHLYLKWTDSTARYGTKAWSPAGAFDARAKVALTCDAGIASFYLIVIDTGNTNRAVVGLDFNYSGRSAAISADTFTSGAYTQRGSTWTVLLDSYMYLRITRDGSNNVSLYFSLNGIIWTLVATVSFTFTVGKIGFLTSNNTGSNNSYAIADWLRTSV